VSENAEPSNITPPPEDAFARLWRRLSEHRVAQWTVGYIALAYGIQHAVILTSESFEWPNIVARGTMLAFVLGLPLVIVFAWYHGEQTTKRITRGELSIISLLLVAIAILFYVFVRPSAEGEATPAAADETSVAEARRASLSPATGVSLAVMPFSDLSADSNQGYFSDGMTEEITTALAKIPDLGVVARQSAFAFKGKDQDVRTVGKALNATHLIEGSVRKAGEQLRISVQLVRASDGRTIWANSYDRELKDVFAVQEDIARSIAASLNMQLGLAPGENLVSDRSIDSETYQQYLRARGLVRARLADQAVTVLEEVVARDPNYAPAWALLPEAYLLGSAYDAVSLRRGSVEDQRRAVQATFGKIEQAARAAIRLDPRLPGGYMGLSLVEGYRRNLVMAESLARQALALDPNDPETLDGASQSLWNMGYFKEAFGLRERLRLLEPFVPTFDAGNGEYMRIARDTETAIRALEKVSTDGPVGERRAVFLARAYAEAGQYGKAADALLAIPANQNRTSKAEAAVAAQLLRGAPAKFTGSLPELPYELAFVYAYVGAPERFLDAAEAANEQGRNVSNEFWNRGLAPLRKTERFKALVRKAGYVDLCRVKGWPDLCHPVGANDFACN
jgi:TolB-like protein/cytochrome c-type biogenesis protein CcmH/NrfG